MRTQLIQILLTTLTLLALGSCTVEEHNDPVPEKSRVLLAYFGVDNNLDHYELEKLEGLRDGWTGIETDRIFAYVDKRSGGAALYELSVSPHSDFILIDSYGTENSADPATFSRVIDYVIQKYKADSYGLLVFSHASGWLPGGTLYYPQSVASLSAATPVPERGPTRLLINDPDTRSIIVDGESEMELTDFAAAIPDGVFDYIVFEACFMAGIEVAYELRNKANYIFASSAEIVDPGFAPIYPSATARLLGADLVGFGQGVFRHTLTYAEDNPQRSATYSVIRTAGLEALAAFVKDNCDLREEVDIADIQHFDRLDCYRLFFDFGDYYGRLLGSEDKRPEFERLLNDCVLWKAATEDFMMQSPTYNGFEISSHSGLTTYIPQTAFPGLNRAYGGLEWAKAMTDTIGVNP